MLAHFWLVFRVNEYLKPLAFCWNAGEAVEEAARLRLADPAHQYVVMMNVWDSHWTVAHD